MSVAYLGVDAAPARTGLALVRDGRVLRFGAVDGPGRCAHGLVLSPTTRAMRAGLEAVCRDVDVRAFIAVVERPLWHPNPRAMATLAQEAGRWEALLEEAGWSVRYVEAAAWQRAIGAAGSKGRRERQAIARQYAEGALGLPPGLGDDEVAAACLAACAEAEDKRAAAISAARKT